jgi:hypothetical protein
VAPTAPTIAVSAPKVNFKIGSGDDMFDQLGMDQMLCL